MNVLVSVIIPVFNGEKYIATCLNSLCNQTLKEIEIIIVNDGSEDNSSVIAHSYAKNDARIIVIDKQNEGVSIARNMALNIAKGEWIAFADVDDYYYSDGLSALYRIAIQFNCRIVIGNSNRIDERGDVSQRYPYINPCIVNKSFPIGSLEMWGDLFHHSLFDTVENCFTPGLAYLEDRFLMLKLLSFEGRYAFCSIPVYVHVKNSDSVLSSPNGLRMAKHCFWAARLMRDFSAKAKYFKSEIIRDSEQAKIRAITYFIKKKNASMTDLKAVYLEFFENESDFYIYIFRSIFQSIKQNIKFFIKTLLK